MKKVITFCVFTLVCLGPILITHGKNPPPIKPQDPCPGTEAGTVALSFGGCDYPGRNQGFPCGPVPRAGADPATFTGTTNLSANPGKWHIKITVRGQGIPSHCSQVEKEFKSTPTNSSSNYEWPITVPKNSVYQITVEFYEDVNQCKANTSGRPKFSYTGTHTGTFVNARLTYDTTI